MLNKDLPERLDGHFLDLFHRNSPTDELAEGGDALVGNAAGDDQIEVAEVGAHVEREAVARDPAADPDADRRELLVADPDPGQARDPAGLDAECGRLRISTSSRSRTYRWTSQRSGRRSRIG